MEIIEKSIHDVIPYDNNPRINDNAVQYVANSIQEFGFKVPIVIDSNNVIIAGHTRLKAAQQLGLNTVPCIVATDLSDEQVKAFRLADNKVSEFSLWNEDMLEKELEGLFTTDMEKFGFIELEELENEEDDKYTSEINIPQYKITGAKPALYDLLDTEKCKELIKEIREADITDNEKLFLVNAAYRHLRFNYRNIAEYYAHSNDEVKRLMEKSALVIIDYDNAIANGFAKLTQVIADDIDEDN